MSDNVSSHLFDFRSASFRPTTPRWISPEFDAFESFEPKSLIQTTLNPLTTSFLFQTVYIVACARTPIGSFNGSLASLSAVQLGAIVIKESISRAGELDVLLELLELNKMNRIVRKIISNQLRLTVRFRFSRTGLKEEDVTDVYMGHVLNAGCGQNTARQAALKAGLPLTTCCTTVNKVCASGMKSILLAAQQIKLGEADIIVAGGMESMSNVPLMMKRSVPVYGGFSHTDGILRDGLQDPDTGRAMGELCEDVAAEMKITREDQDNFAIESYKRSAAAWDKEKGVLAKEVVEVKINVKGVEKIVKEDEEYTNVNFEKLKTLRTVFKKENGTITAANVSVLLRVSCLPYGWVLRKQTFKTNPLVFSLTFRRVP